MLLRSELLDGVAGLTHGFGSSAEPVPESLRADWERSRPTWKQIHGTSIAEVTEAGQSCGEVDGLWTRAPGLPIAVVSADCVRILLARRDGAEAVCEAVSQDAAQRMAGLKKPEMAEAAEAAVAATGWLPPLLRTRGSQSDETPVPAESESLEASASQAKDGPLAGDVRAPGSEASETPDAPASAAQAQAAE